MDEDKYASTKPVYKSKVMQAFSDCTDVSLRMRKLIKEDRRGEILEEVVTHLKLAQRYHFNKLAGEFAKFLQYYYFVINGNKEEGSRYTVLALHYNELGFVDNLVSLKFTEISFLLNRTKNPDEHLLERLEEVCKELRAYLKYDSADVWIFSYILFNVLAYLRGDFDQVIQQSNEVLQYLEARGIDRKSNFYKDQANAYIRTGKYDAATTAIEQAISSSRKGNSHWSVFVYYQLVNELHKKNYQRAYEIYQDAEDKRYIKKNLNKVIFETWYFVKGYIKFLVLAGKIETDAYNFRLGHFLNSIIVFNKDKSGHKINTLILKIILRLDSTAGRKTVMDERDAIKKYSEENFESGSRARVLFRRLMHLVPGDFTPEKIEKRIKRYVPAMPTQSGYDPDLEIIPYEDLWEMILEVLEK